MFENLITQHVKRVEIAAKPIKYAAYASFFSRSIDKTLFLKAMAFYSGSDLLQRLFTVKFLLIYSLCATGYAGRFITDSKLELFLIIPYAISPLTSDVSRLVVVVVEVVVVLYLDTFHQ